MSDTLGDPTVPRRTRGTRAIQPSGPSGPSADHSPQPDTHTGGGSAGLRADFGTFELGAELGRGGMGSVRRAEDPGLHRELAVKLVHAGSAADIARFVEEAQITAQLEHPNIVPVHGLGRDSQGRPWLAMKRIEGGSLAERIHRWKAANGAGPANRPMRLEQLDEALAIFARVCDAVAFAHSRGVIHRDIKPANVMLGEFGEVLLVDWGLARSQCSTSTRTVTTVRSTQAATAADVTASGDIFGTPAYMPPEQAQGRTDLIDERSDIFALGGVLYAMLTLESPYSGATAMAVLAKAAKHQLIAPRRRSPGRGIPRGLEAIVMKAMARRPQDRYPSVTELADDLRAWQSNRSITACRDSVAERIIKWGKRHPARALGTVLTTFFLLVAGVAATLAWAQFERVARERAEADRARRDAEMAAALKAGEVDRVGDMLGVQIRAFRTGLVNSFEEMIDKGHADGLQDLEIVQAMDKSRVGGFIDAFQRIVDHSRRSGRQMHTASDLFHLGLLHGIGMNDADTGIRFLREALAMQPDHRLARNHIAWLLMEAGRYPDALTVLDEQIQRFPDDPAAFLNRCYVHTTLGHLPEALADAEASTTLNPDDAMGWTNLGNVLVETGDTRRALAAYDRAIDRDPDLPQARGRRASLRIDAGDLGGATDDARALGRLRPGWPDSERILGTIAQLSGDTAGAARHYESALELKPDDAATIYARGTLRRDQQNDVAGALADFTRALELDPGQISAYVGRAGLREATGDKQGALADLSEARQRAPQRLDVMVNRALLCLDLGDVDGALADSAAAEARAPESWRALAVRGMVLTAANRKEEARRVLQVALSRCPDAPTRATVEQLLREAGG